MAKLDSISADQKASSNTGISWDLVFRKTRGSRSDRELTRAAVAFSNGRPAAVEYPDGTRRQL